MELIEKLIKLDMLYIREMARRGIIKLRNMGQLTEPLGVHSQSLTVGKATKYLSIKINRDSDITYLKEEIGKLEKEIEESSIKECKFWNGSATEEEKKLDTLAMKRLFFMDTCLVSIKEAAEETGLTETAIKQACQQERLLNTKKIGKTWLVHMYEVRQYWNISTDKEGLYKGWEY